MKVQLPTAAEAELIEAACRVVLGIPYDPAVRGRGAPPPPAGRVQRYCRLQGAALMVDEQWQRVRGVTARIEGADVRIPDVEPKPREVDDA